MKELCLFREGGSEACVAAGSGHPGDSWCFTLAALSGTAAWHNSKRRSWGEEAELVLTGRALEQRWQPSLPGTTGQLLSLGGGHLCWSAAS